jgi:hypothetical protein
LLRHTDVGQPNPIGSVGHKGLVEPVWRHGQGMIAVGRAYAIAAWGSSPDAVLTHHALNPPTADRLPLGTQRGMNSRRTISSSVTIMNPPDIAQKPTIGDLARALRP